MIWLAVVSPPTLEKKIAQLNIRVAELTQIKEKSKNSTFFFLTNHISLSASFAPLLPGPLCASVRSDLHTVQSR